MSNYEEFFNSTSTPTNYLADITRIKTFIENQLKRSRRIVLVTVSQICLLHGKRKLVIHRLTVSVFSLRPRNWSKYHMSKA